MKDSSRMTRRVFLGSLAGAAGGLVLSRRAFGGETKADDPHFFLQVLVTGGMDSTYLLDARPLEMTTAKLQQNYSGKEPAPWKGSNGIQTLAAPAAEALRPHLQDICVVNGVIMSTMFDGHDQNLNVCLTGNPFGGPSALSRLNLDKPLDYLKVGSLLGAVLDDSRFVPLTPAGALALKSRLPSSGENDFSIDPFLQARCRAAAVGSSRFSTGAKALGNATEQSLSLTDRLRALELPPLVTPTPTNDGSIPVVELEQNLALMGEFFRRGIAQSALFDITGTMAIDAHAASTAKGHAALCDTTANRFAQIIAYLKKTPFDGSRSLLDVTTVMFASEFSRTMRQLDRPIDDTGTDHNPFSNSILFAGKGIRAGTVLGGSDFQSSNEELSGAHLSLDADKLKRMGLPIDFETGLVTGAKPTEYTANAYLTIASVVNSIYSLFGVDRQHYWENGRGLGPAPILAALLKG